MTLSKKNLLRNITDYVTFISGLLFILVGTPLILLPPPFAFGIVLVVFGFMLTTTSTPGQNLWRYLRKRWNWLGKKTTNLHNVVRNKLDSRARYKAGNKFDPYARVLITLDTAFKKTKP